MTWPSWIGEQIGKFGLLRSHAKRRALRGGLCSVLFCVTEALASDVLPAQRLAPVGARPVSSAAVAGGLLSPTPIAVRHSASDSAGVDRMQHAVIGTAIGAVVGVALGYHLGKVADAQCSGECGGPRIATLVYPPLYGLLGGAIGALVGYVFPTPRRQLETAESGIPQHE